MIITWLFPPVTKSKYASSEIGNLLLQCKDVIRSENMNITTKKRNNKWPMIVPDEPNNFLIRLCLLHCLKLPHCLAEKSPLPIVCVSSWTSPHTHIHADRHSPKEKGNSRCDVLRFLAGPCRNGLVFLPEKQNRTMFSLIYHKICVRNNKFQLQNVYAESSREQSPRGPKCSLIPPGLEKSWRFCNKGNLDTVPTTHWTGSSEFLFLLAHSPWFPFAKLASQRKTKKWNQYRKFQGENTERSNAHLTSNQCKISTFLFYLSTLLLVRDGPAARYGWIHCN